MVFSQVLTSTLPLPTCKNVGLYEALNRLSADVEETHRTFIFYNEIYCLREGKFPGNFPIIVNYFEIKDDNLLNLLFHQPSTYNHQEEPGIMHNLATEID